MDKTYFISIVIPAYNEEKYITPCLQSLVNLDYPKDKYEIIVETSGSSDKTAEIAQNFGAMVVNTGKKEGVSKSRDNGARAAQGEIIAQTDADTVVPKDWLARINEAFQDEDLVGVTGPCQFINTNWFYKGLSKYVYPALAKLQALLGNVAFIGMNFAIRAETFKKIGGFNVLLNSVEDIDLGRRASKVGKIRYLDNLLVLTSARRMEKSPLYFLWHHAMNNFSYFLLKKTRKFENIR